MIPEMHYVQSSNVEQIGYDEASQELYVRFLKSNITYVYLGVPAYVFQEFLAADSHGKYHHEIIKNCYGFRKE